MTFRNLSIIVIGDEDLVNLAAAHTLLNGGEVYALKAEAMPDQAMMAASFRY